MINPTELRRNIEHKGEMVPQLLRYEIQILLREGFGVKYVAERTSTSVATVRRVRDEEPIHDTDNAAERRKRRIGRPSKAAPFTEKIAEWMLEAPELPTLELLRRAKENGYTGGKSAFYTLVAAARPPKTRHSGS